MVDKFRSGVEIASPIFRYWWQYLISIIIIFLGVGLFLSAKKEVVVFDKLADTVEMETRNFRCQRKLFKKQLTQMYDISIVIRGKDSINYKLLLNFNDGSMLEIMETSNLRRIKLQVYCLKL